MRGALLCPLAFLLTSVAATNAWADAPQCAADWLREAARAAQQGHDEYASTAQRRAVEELARQAALQPQTPGNLHAARRKLSKYRTRCSSAHEPPPAQQMQAALVDVLAAVQELEFEHAPAVHVAWWLIAADDHRLRNLALAEEFISALRAVPWAADIELARLQAAAHAAHGDCKAADSVLQQFITLPHAPGRAEVLQQEQTHYRKGLPLVRTVPQPYLPASVDDTEARIAQVLVLAAHDVRHSAPHAELLLLKLASQFEPLHAVAQRRLGVLLLAEGQPADAVWHLSIAAALLPKDAALFNRLGVAAASQGDFPFAQRCFKRAISLQPRHAAAFANLGQCLLRQQQERAAVAALRQAHRLDPVQLDVANDLAWLLTRTDPQEALRIAADASQRAAHRDGALLSTLAAAQAACGDFVAAVKTLETAVNSVGKLSPPLDLALVKTRLRLYRDGRTAEYAPHEHLQAAEQLLANDRPGEAGRHLLSALTDDPNDVYLNHRVAFALAEAGEFAAAAEYLGRVLQLEPERAAALADLGRVRLQLGDVSAAVDAFQRALELQPDLLHAANNLAWVLATDSNERVRDPAEATRVAGRAAAQSDRQDADVLATLAVSQAAQGDFAAAVRSTEEVLALHEQHANLSLLEEHRARRELFQANVPFRSSANMRLTLARLSLEAHEADRAVEHALAGIATAGPRPALLTALGLGRVQQGKLAEAELQFQRVLEQQPEFLPAANNLAWLWATAADETIRRPLQALQLAEQVVARSGRRDAAYLDTLAAAQAALGNWRDAVSTAQRALEATAGTSERQLRQQRLERYRQQRPLILPW